MSHLPSTLLNDNFYRDVCQGFTEGLLESLKISAIIILSIAGLCTVVFLVVASVILWRDRNKFLTLQRMSRARFARVVTVR